jgi:hypothetical protein
MAKIRVTFCERLRRDCVQNARKKAFGPEKTRFKKSLIISFVAMVNWIPAICCALQLLVAP